MPNASANYNKDKSFGYMHPVAGSAVEIAEFKPMDNDAAKQK